MFVKRTAFVAGFSAVLLTVNLVSAQTYTVRGGAGLPFRALEDTRNKLEVYLIYGSVGLGIEYTVPSDDGTAHQWFRYRQGVHNAEPVSSTQTGATSTVLNPLPGYGYFVGLPSHPSTHYIYLIDYATVKPSLTSFTYASASDPCGMLGFSVEGTVPKILYYIPSSLVPSELKRSFTLSYQTLEWSEEDKVFTRVNEDASFADPFSLSIPAPLCDTEFRLSGDSFAEHFGLSQEFLSPVYAATAVVAYADTVLLSPAAPPNQYSASQGLSAPVSLHFTGRANDPVSFLYLWTIYREGEADKPIVRFTGKEIDYTFTTAGRYTATLGVSNRDGSCSDDSQQFTFEVSETYIDIPNAFSPGATPGVNDEFRIVYKSITNFKGYIFNRWGNKLFYWTDPAVGWDGRIKGRLAPSGTYFYVIEYRDSQGRPQKHTGPVHLMNSTTSSAPSSDTSKQ
ncbi:MAG: gliding motility-associated C-terminal domain-containing protein [Tannerellaceae bacterium]|jgi:gliding motility-associated-like protein|nr:gliding motility-associated C-terminal domain-containing protein [Tannerellaceae bacterium]